jgi:hypothetical protein
MKYIGISKETCEWIKHLNFTFARLKSYFFSFHLFICFLLFFIFISDATIPFSHFLLPNPYDKYKLEERKIIFNGGGLNGDNIRSLIMKEGIKDGMMQVFVLCFVFYLCDCYLFLIIMIIFYVNYIFFCLYSLYW